jgi:PBP1b-binding outer membrane lipoprotein LpoB
VRNRIALLLILSVLLAGCVSIGTPGNASNSALAAKIKQVYSGADSVKVTERLQTFPKSWRSPIDNGTSYIVNARLTYAGGSTKVLKLG